MTDPNLLCVSSAPRRRHRRRRRCHEYLCSAVQERHSQEDGRQTGGGAAAEDRRGVRFALVDRGMEGRSRMYHEAIHIKREREYVVQQ